MQNDGGGALAQRRRARLIAFEALYEHDVAGHSPLESLERRLSTTGVSIDTEYLRAVVEGIEQHLPEIDGKLSEAAPAWPLDQMAKVDKAILRLAIYEIVFDNAVPVKAAIHEAVELAKQYGSESSGKFVNGVLGSIINQTAQSS